MPKFVTWVCPKCGFEAKGHPNLLEMAHYPKKTGRSEYHSMEKKNEVQTDSSDSKEQ